MCACVRVYLDSDLCTCARGWEAKRKVGTFVGEEERGLGTSLKQSQGVKLTLLQYWLKLGMWNTHTHTNAYTYEDSHVLYALVFICDHTYHMCE